MKTFISYSWSSPMHEKWVLQLATELMENGVEIILDKWDLKEGQDSITFMEEMVNNPEIEKVIIVTDKKYAEKANNRDGGVGKETQIISKEIYDNVKQEKFVAVISEKDENGKPYLPRYYQSRIYIDLNEPDKYSENFEILLRWIFNKPLYKKPPVGKFPDYLDEKKSNILGTSFAQKRLVTAIKEKKETLGGILNEYLSLFSENLKNFRIQKPEKGEYDELIIETIEAFKPYKNEFLQVLLNLGQYGMSSENTTVIHRFFESMIHYFDRDENSTQRYTTWDFDVFKFIAHELFLNTIAVFLKFEKFESVSFLLSQKYYIAQNLMFGETLKSYTVFQDQLKSLEYRNKRLSSRRLSIRADLLKERSEGSGLEFRYIMQADFVCFTNADLNHKVYLPDLG
jgi:hypothetical protein